MKRYLQSILIFDFALPALLLGIPCSVLFWAIMSLQSSEAAKEEEHSAYETLSRQVAALSAELQPMQAEVLLAEDPVVRRRHGGQIGNRHFRQSRQTPSR